MRLFICIQIAIFALFEFGNTPIQKNNSSNFCEVPQNKKTKSIVSQKLRIVQEKSFMQKMSIRSIPIDPTNLTSFEES